MPSDCRIGCLHDRLPGKFKRGYPRRSRGALGLVRASLAAITFTALVAAGSAMARGGEITCPKGTVPNGEDTQDVKEAWCEVLWHGKKVEHGPYRAWWPDGKLGTTGQYVYGKAEGKWRRWSSTGQLQEEEWFENGRKVKDIYYDDKGRVTHPPET